MTCVDFLTNELAKVNHKLHVSYKDHPVFRERILVLTYKHKKINADRAEIEVMLQVPAHILLALKDLALHL